MLAIPDLQRYLYKHKTYLELEKRLYLSQFRSEYGFQGTVVNEALPS